MYFHSPSHKIPSNPAKSCIYLTHSPLFISVPFIKDKTYGWLMQKQDVLAFVQARAAEGGAGALIVLLAGTPRKG